MMKMLRSLMDNNIKSQFMADAESIKQHYRSNCHNQDVMVREIDMIRSQKGW